MNQKKRQISLDNLGNVLIMKADQNPPEFLIASMLSPSSTNQPPAVVIIMPRGGRGLVAVGGRVFNRSNLTREYHLHVSAGIIFSIMLSYKM